MTLARAFFALLLIGSAIAEIQPAQAEELIPAQVIIRRFPVTTFCPPPIPITFTAPVTPVTITFTARQWVSDGSQLQWTDQAIDNVFIAKTSIVAANQTLVPWETCYDGNEVTFFKFDTPGLEIAYLDLFDTDPVARGWSGSALTSFVNGRSGTRSPIVNPGDHDGGSYRIGDGSGTPDPNATQSATFTVSNLVEGQSYDLGFWWSCNFVRFPPDTDFLTITVMTGTTPIATRSWGAVKSTYRR